MKKVAKHTLTSFVTYFFVRFSMSDNLNTMFMQFNVLLCDTKQRHNSEKYRFGPGTITCKVVYYVLWLVFYKTRRFIQFLGKLYYSIFVHVQSSPTIWCLSAKSSYIIILDHVHRTGVCSQLWTLHNKLPSLAHEIYLSPKIFRFQNSLFSNQA